MKKIIIAIDGYSSSGKSTMARELARQIGYTYIDSGAMYRAVTLAAMSHGLVSPGQPVDVPALVALLPAIHITFSAPDDNGVQHTMLNGHDVEREIRDMKVSACVSPVAVIPEVRRHLVHLQQLMGEDKGIVMDGRDIGTTVFPDAEMKVFVDASAETRAKRRFLELKQKGTPADYDEVYRNICERDRIDTTREVSPLRRADDAHILDNSDMTPEQQMDWLMALYHKILREVDGEKRYRKLL